MEEDSRLIKFRQAIWDYKKDAFHSFHYWGYIDGKFVPPLLTVEESVNDRFTGLKTKETNIEIYEGDILLTPEGFYYRVYWPDGDGSNFYIDRNFIDGFSLARLEGVYDELEHAGNIWQNWNLFVSDENLKPPTKAELEGVFTCDRCGERKTVIPEVLSDASITDALAPSGENTRQQEKTI